jgi:Aminotransferase class-V
VWTVSTWFRLQIGMIPRRDQSFGTPQVAIRAVDHCCQPLMARLGVPATIRASFYLYTVRDEIDRLVDGLQKVRRSFAWTQAKAAVAPETSTFSIGG